MLMKAAARVVSFQRKTKTPQTNLPMKEIAEEVKKRLRRHLICEQKPTVLCRWLTVLSGGCNLATRHKYDRKHHPISQLICVHIFNDDLSVYFRLGLFPSWYYQTKFIFMFLCTTVVKKPLCIFFQNPLTGTEKTVCYPKCIRIVIVLYQYVHSRATFLLNPYSF